MKEHTAIQKFVEMTGINLEFYHPPENDDGTYFNTMIASGDLPDIIKSNFDKYPGKIVGAINDGIIVDYTDLVYQYAPNFLTTIGIRGNNTRRNVISDEGQILRILCEINDVGIPGEDYPGLEGRQHTGLIMRKDWLDDLGLAEPRLVDEVTEALIQFRDVKKAKFPYAMGKVLTDWIYDNNNALSGAFGVAVRGYQIDANGKVQYGRAMPAYKDFLKLMRHWFEEKLIDSDFVSRTGGDANKLFIGGSAGMLLIGNWGIREVLQLGKMEDPNFDIVPLQAMRLKDPDAPMDLAWPYESGNSGTTIHIATTCKDQVLAMKWIDSLYMQEVLELMTWGVGELPDGNRTYTIDENGLHKWTDFINNNPLQPYNTFRFVYSYQDFQSSYDIDMQKQQYNSPKNILAWEKWTYNSSNKGRLPDGVTLMSDEATRISELQNVITTYSDETIMNFIFGEEDIEKGFDAFVKKINELGLPEILETYQRAYDRFKAR